MAVFLGRNLANVYKLSGGEKNASYRARLDLAVTVHLSSSNYCSVELEIRIIVG